MTNWVPGRQRRVQGEKQGFLRIGPFPPGPRWQIPGGNSVLYKWKHSSICIKYVHLNLDFLPFHFTLFSQAPPVVSKYFHTIKGCLWADETNIWGEGKRREEGGWGVGPRTRSSEKQHLSLGKLIQSGPPRGPQSHAVLRAVRQVPVCSLPPYTTPGPGLWSKPAQIYSLDIIPLFHRNVPV